MEEKFKNEEEKSNNREDQSSVAPAYGTGSSSIPFYSPMPVFTPSPMYIQPDYRAYYPTCNCHTHHSHQNPYHGSHIQPEKMDSKEHQRSIPDLCRRYRYHFVQLEGTDGHTYDGIIESVDNENVYLLEPAGDKERDNQDELNRQFDYDYGYGYGGFPPYGYGYPRRFRRFRRRRFPFFFFRRLFFPYFY